MSVIEINQRLIDLDSGKVCHGDEVSQLSPKLFTLLNQFIEHCDEVISRDTLIEAVWGHVEAATDDSVNVAVSSLRHVIGDDRRPHRILRAIPRRGYLFEAKGCVWLQPHEVEQRLTATAGAAKSRRLQQSELPQWRWTSLLFAFSAMLVLALIWWLAERSGDAGLTSAQGSMPSGPAVAVLPFVDMSVAGDQQAFADGLVDRIIHMLTLSPELKVIARTSSFAFRETAAGIDEIADKLDVETVLEGSVQHSADQVRVLAQLIDAKTEKHIWSRSYDRPLGELFALQDEIANEVARTLTDSLLPDRDTRHPNSQKVWELVTRGRLALDLFTLESATEASEHFRQALELQPDSVEALVGMVDAISMQRSLGPFGSSASGEDRTEPYLERARQLAPDSASVARATGNWHFNHDRPEEAVAAYRRAIAINPNDADSYRLLGRVLFRQARYDDAIEPLRTAVRLDPFSGLGSVWLADALWAVGRAEEALFRLDRIIEDQPDFAQAHDRIATYLTQTGETGRAMRHIIRAREIDPDSPRRWFRVCEFWLQLGDDVAAERCTDELTAAHDVPFYGGYLRQIIHGFRGEWDAHLHELEALVALGHDDPITRSVLAQSYSRTDCPRALQALEDSFPGLFGTPPELNPTLLLATNTAVYCLRETGRGNQASVLLDAMASLVERTRLERAPWAVAGFEQAFVLALSGDHEAALDSLEELIDDGWRYYWWGLDYYPTFAPIVEDPRFRALHEKLEAGVREQREWFEANREAPLI